jgi:hypothetical protein
MVQKYYVYWREVKTLINIYRKWTFKVWIQMFPKWTYNASKMFHTPFETGLIDFKFEYEALLLKSCISRQKFYI